MKRIKTCGCIVEIYYDTSIRGLETKVKYIKKCKAHEKPANSIKIDKSKIKRKKNGNRTD